MFTHKFLTFASVCALAAGAAEGESAAAVVPGLLGADAHPATKAAPTTKLNRAKIRMFFME